MLPERAKVCLPSIGRCAARFIYREAMKDSKWPGWGNGILGDCGSPDPGSIPGPGPTNSSSHSSVNEAPQ